MDENNRRYFRITKGMIRAIQKGRTSVLASLEILGTLIARDVKKKITDLRKPKLKKATIRRKGSSNPLVDTGQMRASVRHKVEMDGKS